MAANQLRIQPDWQLAVAYVLFFLFNFPFNMYHCANTSARFCCYPHLPRDSDDGGQLILADKISPRLLL